MALPASRRLAACTTVSLADLTDEPFIALPAAAGSLRRFWLAADERSTTPGVAAEAETAEESFEAVASGLGVVLLAAGNAEIYQRDDVIHVPSPGSRSGSRQLCRSRLCLGCPQSRARPRG